MAAKFAVIGSGFGQFHGTRIPRLRRMIECRRNAYTVVMTGDVVEEHPELGVRTRYQRVCRLGIAHWS